MLLVKNLINLFLWIARVFFICSDENMVILQSFKKYIYSKKLKTFYTAVFYFYHILKIKERLFHVLTFYFFVIY